MSCAPERAGKILINDQQKYAGGWIADMSINVDIIQGSSAEATVVNDEGNYSSPALGVSLGSQVKISIKTDDGKSAFATDYFPIESSSSVGPGGKLLKVSFIEAGPSLIRKIPVFVRGRMMEDKAKSGGMILNIGERYFTSPNQGGELLKISNLSTKEYNKIFKGDGVTRNNALKANITALFTGRELYKGIQACRIPHTKAFYNYCWNILEGQYFSNGGDLYSVLQEAGRRLGVVIYWNGFVDGGYVPIETAASGGPGAIGLDVFTSAANINTTISDAAGKAGLIRGTSTTSLRGTSALGNTHSLTVAPNNIANMERGIVGSVNIGGASTKTQIKDCKGGDQDVSGEFFRADGSKKKPDADLSKKLIDYCRLVNAARMGQTFFTLYVYLKLVALQHDDMVGRKGNTNYETAYAWGDIIKQPVLQRNEMVELLFSDCVTISCPYKTTSLPLAPDLGAGEIERPWSYWGNIASITKEVRENANAAVDEETVMVAYLRKLQATYNDDNLVDVDQFNAVYESILASFDLVSKEVFLIPGDESLACGKHTEKNTVTVSWEKETKLYAPFPITETNPWEIMTEDHEFYVLAQQKATAADWEAAETIIIKKKSNGFNCVTLVSYLRGSYATLAEAATVLSCPDAEKQTSKAKKDGDDTWACDTQRVEMMPDGIIAWGTKQTTEGLTSEDAALGAWLTKRLIINNKGKEQGAVKSALDNIDAEGNAHPPGFTCLLLPYMEVEKDETNFKYLYQEEVSAATATTPAKYKTKSQNIVRVGDEVDIFLDGLDNAFSPLNIHSKLITNTPQIAYEKLGPTRNFFSSSIAGGNLPAINITNPNNTVQLEEVLKGQGSEEGKWAGTIKKITCDGTIKGGSGGASGKISYSSGLSNKVGLIQNNLDAMARQNTEWNYNPSIGGSFTYAGVPDIPTIWQGLMGLGIQMTAQGGLTTTITLGQIKMQRANYQQQQQGSLRNFVLAAGYDSVNQFFGSKFKNNTQQTLGGGSVGISKPNQANTLGDTSVPPPKKS